MLAYSLKIPIFASLARLLRVLYESNIFRILVLLALTAYAYHPFFTENNMGNRDAQFYQYMLHDALIQLKNGYFPPYAGQSVFAPLGTPHVNAPMYLFFGILLNAITFGELSPLLIQHLTIFFSAFLAVIILYVLVRALSPNLKWQAVFIAFLYISCPAIMALPYSLDAYLSFMAIPFIPIVFYGAIQIYRKNRLQDYILVSVAFACLLMAHAPITFWTLFLFGPVFLLLALRQKFGIYKLALAAILFIGLSIWQVVLVISFNKRMLVNSAGFFPSPGVLLQRLEELTAFAADSFLPLQIAQGPLPFLQLGYSLWMLLGVSLCMALIIRRFYSSDIFMLGVTISLVILFLYPFLGVSHYFWAIVPSFILEWSGYVVKMRLFPILAGMVVIYSSIVLSNVAEGISKKQKIYLTGFLLILFSWNIHQVTFFIDHGNKTKEANYSTQMPRNSWANPDSLYYFSYGLPEEFILQGFTAGNYSYESFHTLRNSMDEDIYELGNKNYALNNCFNDKVKSNLNNIHTLPFRFELREPTVLGEFLVKSNQKYYICIDQTSEKNKKVFYQILDDHLRERAVQEIPVSENLPTNHNLLIPILLNSKTNLIGLTPLALRVWSTEKSLLVINNLGLIEDFQESGYPIKVNSLTPYKAKVHVKNSEKYLEVPKLYNSGYQGYINGEKVDLRESTRKTILVPLRPNEINDVEIHYEKRVIEKISITLSLILWLLIAFYLLVKFAYAAKSKFSKV
jgi:hypothetical protein